MPDGATAKAIPYQYMQRQLLRYTQGAVRGVAKTVLQHRVFDFLSNAVRVRPAAARHLAEQVKIVAPDLVELLARIAHQFACPRYVPKVLGKLQQAELATCYFLVRGHTVLLLGHGQVGVPVYLPSQ